MADIQNGYTNFTAQQSKKRLGVHFSKKELGILAVILFLALGGSIALYVVKENELAALKQQVAGDSTTAEYQLILESIRKLVTIPTDETVRIALVDDPAKLQAENPTFYAEVKAGQYLVIMPDSQKVLIYDKNENRIVNFSSYSIKVDLIDENEIPASEKPLIIEVRTTSEVTEETVNNVVASLEKASTNYKISSVTQTTNSNFKGVTLILLNRTAKPKMSQNIVAHTGTSSILEALPDGEVSSTADVVIIVGKI